MRLPRSVSLFVATLSVCVSDLIASSSLEDVYAHSDPFTGFFTHALFDQITHAVPSQQCRRQLTLYKENASNFTLWAMQMLDATSKLPSGILGGSVCHLGHFDECLAVDNGGSGDDRIAGKYCLASVEVTPKTPPKKCSTDDVRKCSAWEKLAVSGNRMKLRRNRIQTGICIPSGCTGRDLQTGLALLQTKLQTVSLNVEIDERMCQVENLESEIWLSLFWCTVIAYISFLLAYDKIVLRKKMHGLPLSVSERAFDVRAHWQWLTSREAREGSEDSIDCIHGGRVLCMVAVVLGHRGEAIGAGPLVNADAVEVMYEDFFGILVMNGHLIVDVFFTLSGFLLTWNLLRYLGRGGKLNMLTVYFLRYIRLTPTLMLVVAFEALILFDLSSGPLWHFVVGRERDNCRNYWWANLLYVNNYVHPESPCVDPSWYLACDMQLFLVATLVALSLHKWKQHAFKILSAAISIATLIPFVITYLGDLDPTIIADPSTLGHSVENATYVSVYVTAYCRAGPYFVGMAFAYWLNNLKSSNRTLSKGTLWAGWLLGPLSQLAMLSAAGLFYQPDHQLSKLSVALYAALHRTVVAVGVGFYITASALGQGGYFNEFLSWNRLRPLSRLTYALFLCHTVVQMYHFASLKTQLHGSFTDVLWFGTSDLILAIIFATILYLAVERPVMVFAMSLFEMNSKKDKYSNGEPIRPKENGKGYSLKKADEPSVTLGFARAQKNHLEWSKKKRG